MKLPESRELKLWEEPNIGYTTGYNYLGGYGYFAKESSIPWVISDSGLKYRKIVDNQDAGMGLDMDMGSGGRAVEGAATTLAVASVVEPLSEVAPVMAEALVFATIAVGGIDLIRKAVAGEIGAKKP